MKLEVGKWCRTKEGTIFKIIGGNVDMWEIDIDYSYLSKCENEDYNSYAYNKNNSLFEELVIKSSYNIIDLIKVGDYVNGSKVIDISIIGKDKEKWVWVEQMEDSDNKYGDDYVGYNNDQIKSIVTKEMFSNVEYRVETN